MTRHQIGRAATSTLRDRLDYLDTEIATLDRRQDLADDHVQDLASRLCHEADQIDEEIALRSIKDDRVRQMMGEG